MRFVVEISNLDNDKSRLCVEEYLHSFIYHGFNLLYETGELINEPNININFVKE